MLTQSQSSVRTSVFSEYMLRYGAAYSVQVPPTIFAATIALPNCANHPTTLLRAPPRRKLFSPSCTEILRVESDPSSSLQPSTGHRSISPVLAYVFFVCFPKFCRRVSPLDPRSWVGLRISRRQINTYLSNRRLKLLDGTVRYSIILLPLPPLTDYPFGIPLPNPQVR